MKNGRKEKEKKKEQTFQLNEGQRDYNRRAESRQREHDEHG